MKVDIEDTQSLLGYLRSDGRIGQNEQCDVRKLSLGVSNKTLLFTRENGVEWVIKQSLSKLRVKQDWYSAPQRIKIEYEGLKWLAKVLPPEAVPVPIFFDEPNFVLCMSAVPRPHDNLKLLILKGDIDPALFAKLGNLLGIIHNAGRTSREAATLFGDRSYFRELRIEPFYKFTAKGIPELNSFFSDLISQTLKVQETVVHGDYSPKNILVRNQAVVLLDYEVMHFGDPAFDIGFFLCQMLSFTNHLNDSRDRLAAASRQFWDNYQTTVHRVTAAAESRAVQHTIGCLLARVLGRSPVNFLSEEEKLRQVRVAKALAEGAVRRIPDLIATFNERL